MNTKLALTLAFLFGCTLTAQGQNNQQLPLPMKNMTAAAASKADVAKVADCANKLCVKGMRIDNTGNPYFDHKGLRYTISAGPLSLVIWVRPVGTTARTDRREYSDHGSDGVVDEGSSGSVSTYFKGRDSTPIGVEWKGYYQDGYNQAITAILEYIASFKTAK